MTKELLLALVDSGIFTPILCTYYIFQPLISVNLILLVVHTIIFEQVHFGSLQFNLQIIGYKIKFADNFIHLLLLDLVFVLVVNDTLVVVIFKPKFDDLTVLFVNQLILLFHVSLEVIKCALGSCYDVFGTVELVCVSASFASLSD